MLAESNEGLQQRARQVLDLRNKGRPVVTGGLSQLEGADTRYRCGAAKQPYAWLHLCTCKLCLQSKESMCPEQTAITS